MNKGWLINGAEAIEFPSKRIFFRQISNGIWIIALRVQVFCEISAIAMLIKRTWGTVNFACHFVAIDLSLQIYRCYIQISRLRDLRWEYHVKLLFGSGDSMVKTISQYLFRI